MFITRQCDTNERSAVQNLYIVERFSQAKRTLDLSSERAQRAYFKL